MLLTGDTFGWVSSCFVSQLQGISMTEVVSVPAEQAQVSSTQVRAARRIASKLLAVLDRTRFRSLKAEYTAFNMCAKRDEEGVVSVKVAGAEVTTKLSPDRSNRLKSKRQNIVALATRLAQKSAVISYLSQVM